MYSRCLPNCKVLHCQLEEQLLQLADPNPGFETPSPSNTIAAVPPTDTAMPSVSEPYLEYVCNICYINIYRHIYDDLHILDLLKMTSKLLVRL